LRKSRLDGRQDPLSGQFKINQNKPIINIRRNVIMKKYVCEVCGWEYDEALGDPENGIAPGTKFDALPEDFACPLCGVGKDQFAVAE
jgi:rubredoxin-NAD+ reductase